MYISEPQKHGEWLPDFHFQETISLFINYMNIAKQRNCPHAIAQSRVAQLRYSKMLFFRAKSLRNGSKLLRSVPQKLRKSFANENPNLDSFLFYWVQFIFFSWIQKIICSSDSHSYFFLINSGYLYFIHLFLLTV